MENQPIQNAIISRNKLWHGNPAIPKWVDIENTPLDQFFTKPQIAEFCFNNLKDIIRQNGDNESEYKFIEPSAGGGAFYDLLPSRQCTHKIGTRA